MRVAVGNALLAPRPSGAKGGAFGANRRLTAPAAQPCFDIFMTSAKENPGFAGYFGNLNVGWSIRQSACRHGFQFNVKRIQTLECAAPFTLHLISSKNYLSNSRLI